MHMKSCKWGCCHSVLSEPLYAGACVTVEHDSDNQLATLWNKDVSF